MSKLGDINAFAVEEACNQLGFDVGTIDNLPALVQVAIFEKADYIQQEKLIMQAEAIREGDR